MCDKSGRKEGKERKRKGNGKGEISKTITVRFIYAFTGHIGKLTRRRSSFLLLYSLSNKPITTYD